MCTSEPPISSSVTSSPVAARTRCRPPSAIEDVPLTIGMKSASAGMYAVPAAQCPSMAATCGTTPLNVTCSRKSAPAAANVEPEDDWMRAPAESSSHTIGMRWRSASSRIRDVFDSPMAPIDPASTVKSYAQIATLRPSMAPMPATIPSAARYPRSAWSTGSIESAS